MSSHHALSKPASPALISSVPQISRVSEQTEEKGEDSTQTSQLDLKLQLQRAGRLGHHLKYISPQAGVPPLQAKPEPSTPESTEGEEHERVSIQTKQISGAAGDPTGPDGSGSASSPTPPGDNLPPVSLRAQRQQAEQSGHHFSRIQVFADRPQPQVQPQHFWLQRLCSECQQEQEHKEERLQASPWIQLSRVAEGVGIQRQEAPPAETQGEPRLPEEEGIEVLRSGIVSNPDTSLYGSDPNGAGVNLRNQPNSSADPAIDAGIVVERLPFAARVFVDREINNEWYFITLESGQRGYVNKHFVAIDLPEPAAKLHLVDSNELGEDIVNREYNFPDDWGQDIRFYANVLVHVNQNATINDRPVRGIGDNPDQVIAGEMLWIPSLPYANSLQGTVNSGSLTYELYRGAEETLGAAGEFLVGSAAFVSGLLRGALEWIRDAIVGIAELLGLLWDLIESIFTGSLLGDIQSLWDVISNLNVQEIITNTIDNFVQQWNDDNIVARWHFRGRVIGYAIAEIVSWFLGIGAILRMIKVADKIKDLSIIQRLRTVVDRADVPPQIREALGEGAEAATDGTRVMENASQVLSRYQLDEIPLANRDEFLRWERGITEDTRVILEGNPQLARTFAEMNPQVRAALTFCNSPCIPPHATPQQATRLGTLLQNPGMDGTSTALKRHLHNTNSADELDEAISRLENAHQQIVASGRAATTDDVVRLAYVDSIAPTTPRAGAPPIPPASLDILESRGFAVSNGVATKTLNNGFTIEITVDSRGLFQVSQPSTGIRFGEYDAIPRHGGIPSPAADGILQSHHGAQDLSMRTVFGDYGYTRDGVPSIWLRTHRGGSPHTHITSQIQNPLRASRSSPTPSYAQIREWAIADLKSAGAPNDKVSEYISSLDQYFESTIRPQLNSSGLSQPEIDALVGDY